MHIETLEKCPTCKGSGEVTPAVLLDEEIENKLAFLVNEKGIKKIQLKLHPFVAAFLNKGFISKRRKWTWRYNCKLRVTPISSFSFLEYHFFDLDDNEIDF
jgi:ribonuclease G